MIRGYFLARGARKRPFIDAEIWFPAFGNRSIDVPLLIDTGADRTILAPNDASQLVAQLGVRLADLPEGPPSTGVGGRMATRIIEVVLSLDTFVTVPLALTILEPP